jgi:hypothetical protein
MKINQKRNGFEKSGEPVSCNDFKVALRMAIDKKANIKCVVKLQLMNQFWIYYAKFIPTYTTERFGNLKFMA